MARMPETGEILPFPTASSVGAPSERLSPEGNRVRSALLAAAERYADSQGGGEGFFAVPDFGVHVMRTYEPIDHHQVYRPSLCITLQGLKQILVGGQMLSYGPMDCLIVGLDLPARGRIVAASGRTPFVGIKIEFDIAVMRDVLEQLDTRPTPTQGAGRSMFVSAVEGPLAHCVLRMIELTDTPKAMPILYPALMREFYYWLLTGPNAGDLCKQIIPGTYLERIAEAIRLLRKNFAQTLRMEALAAAAHMSLSSFHQHFKALTSMTPLQFQKQLRLLEARRLMMVDDMNVAEAAYRVGYESASQFSREYSRAFGVAPKRDAMNVKVAGA